MRYELRDQHGQPLRLFKANRENNAAKAIDQLSGICSGILADGTVNDAEATFFADWVRTYAKLQPVWPFTDILARVERIFADGVCDHDEREEIKAILEAICGRNETTDPSQTYATALPLDTPLPTPVIHAGRKFNITGRFAFGVRKKVAEEIEKLGGTAVDTPPTRDSHYLVIGMFASQNWINTNHGRKIERAVELRESGSGLSIISEEHWRQFIASAAN